MRSKEVVSDVDGMDHEGEGKGETPKEGELKASNQQFGILEA